MLKTVELRITEDEAVLDSAIDSIARGLGWTDEVLVEGELVPNPETQLECIRKYIMASLGGIAQTYNANLAAEQAKLAALEATVNAIGNITSTLEVV